METLILVLVIVGLLVYFQKRFFLSSRYVPIDKKRVCFILRQNFDYYNHLSSANQRVFEDRVVRFIHKKKFVPRNFPKVSLAMKVLISAAAVQLTFGLPEISLQHFRYILIYPQEYYSIITERHHKGEVNPAAGTIVLSWNNFIEGYATPHDSLNVGLHEMAHALELENMIHNDEYDFLSPTVWQEWLSLAQVYRQQMLAVPSDFFRDYAATNDKEFFAVAVENFFERPGAFEQQAPMLYHVLVRLLNQNPLMREKPVMQ